jgi:RNA polymerase sigma-70 factor, ECF subfamily
VRPESHGTELELETGQGLPAAFEDLVVLHGSALHGYLARRVPAAADDLLSEVWLAAFAGRGRYDPERGSARGWLFGVARNVMLAHLRQAEPPPRAGPEPVDDVWDAVVARLDAAAVAPRLQSALAALPGIERELLLLVAWEQLSPAEAAQAVGVPAGTARSRLHRARNRMREQLDRDLAVERGEDR